MSRANDEPTEDQRAASEPRIFTSHFVRRRSGHGLAFSDSPVVDEGPVCKPARVAQMLASAHRLQCSIDSGKYKDQAEAARHLGLTRSRITQLMDLTLLAPDIQEEILDLERIDGQEPLTERALRPVLRTAVWADQRAAWDDLKPVGSGRP